MKLNEFCEEFKDTCGKTTPTQCLERLVGEMSKPEGGDETQGVFQAVNGKYVALDEESRDTKCLPGDEGEDEWDRDTTGSPTQPAWVHPDVMDKDEHLSGDKIKDAWESWLYESETEEEEEGETKEEEEGETEEEVETEEEEGETKEEEEGETTEEEQEVETEEEEGEDDQLLHPWDSEQEGEEMPVINDTSGTGAAASTDTTDDPFADDKYDELAWKAMDTYERNEIERSREKAEMLAEEVDWEILANEVDAEILANEVDAAYSGLNDLQHSVEHGWHQKIEGAEEAAAAAQEAAAAAEEAAAEQDFEISKEAMETLSAIDMANKDSLALLGLDLPPAGLTSADVNAAYELQLQSVDQTFYGERRDDAERPQKAGRQQLENARRLILAELTSLGRRHLLESQRAQRKREQRLVMQAKERAKWGPALWRLGGLKPGMQGFNEELATYMQDQKLGFAGLGMSCDNAKEAHAYQRVLANTMSQPSPAKRMLVNWATGTGKTGAMIAILDKYFDRPMNKLVIVPKRSIKDNFIEELLATPNRYKQEFEKAMNTDAQDNSKISKKISKKFTKLRELYKILRDKEAEFLATKKTAVKQGVLEADAQQAYKARLQALAPERSILLQTFMKLGTLTGQLPAPLFVATYQEIGQVSEIASPKSMFSRQGTYVRLDGKTDNYRLDNSLILCDEAHNMVCPSGDLTSVARELIKNAGARIAQSLRAVVGLFTATPIQYNILEYLRLMVIVKGPKPEEAANPSTYKGFDLNDRIPAAKDHPLCDSRKVLSVAAEKALYARMVASWRQTDGRNEQGFVSSFHTRPKTVFARVRPNYTRLQGRQLTKKLILPCVLQGRSLQHYIKYRFFPNDKMPVECLRSDDLAITDGSPPQKLHFTKVANKYKMLPKSKKLDHKAKDIVQFVNQGVQALQDEEVAWLQDYETLQNVMEYGTEVDKTLLLAKLKTGPKLLNCSFPLHGDPQALLQPKSAGGCVSTLQKYENVAAVKVRDLAGYDLADYAALSSKFGVLIEHLKNNPKKTVILLHRSNGFQILMNMLEIAQIKTMVLPHKAGSGEMPGLFMNTAYDDQTVGSVTARAYFNAPNNCLGQAVEVALISAEDYSEGVSFQEVRQVILADLSPSINHVSWADIAQRIGRGVRMCSHKLAMTDCAAGLQTVYPTVDVKVCLAELPTDAEAIRRAFPKMSAKCMALIVGQKTVEQQKWDGVLLTKKKYDYYLDIIKSDSVEAAMEANIVAEHSSSEEDEQDVDVNSGRLFVHDYIQQLMHKHQAERPATVPIRTQPTTRIKPAREAPIGSLVSADVNPFRIATDNQLPEQIGRQPIVPLLSVHEEVQDISSLIGNLHIGQS